jgi:hypothetical protein
MELQVSDKIWDRLFLLYGEKVREKVEKVLEGLAYSQEPSYIRTTLPLRQDHFDFLRGYCVLFNIKRLDFLSDLIESAEFAEPEKPSGLVRKYSLSKKPLTISFYPNRKTYQKLESLAQSQNCSMSYVIERLIDGFWDGMMEGDRRAIVSLTTTRKDGNV